MHHGNDVKNYSHKDQAIKDKQVQKPLVNKDSIFKHLVYM